MLGCGEKACCITRGHRRGVIDQGAGQRAYPLVALSRRFQCGIGRARANDTHEGRRTERSRRVRSGPPGVEGHSTVGVCHRNRVVAKVGFVSRLLCILRCERGRNLEVAQLLWGLRIAHGAEQEHGAFGELAKACTRGAWCDRDLW